MNLSRAIAHEGPEEYRDPRLFFERIHLTRTLQSLIRDALNTLHAELGAAAPLNWGLTALCYHGLVVRHNDLEHYRVAGQLFADWFKFRAEQHLSEAQGNLEHAQLPPETKIYYIGTQTNINNAVDTVASGQFQSATSFGGGEAVDQRQAQGPLYKPQNTVEQDFNTKGDNENDSF